MSLCRNFLCITTVGVSVGVTGQERITRRGLSFNTLLHSVSVSALTAFQFHEKIKSKTAFYASGPTISLSIFEYCEDRKKRGRDRSKVPAMPCIGYMEIWEYTCSG